MERTCNGLQMNYPNKFKFDWLTLKEGDREREKNTCYENEQTKFTYMVMHIIDRIVSKISLSLVHTYA